VSGQGFSRADQMLGIHAALAAARVCNGGRCGAAKAVP
jgi:hypothetical protein